MQEIRCPKCGEVFAVDESGYNRIVKQVRDKKCDYVALRCAVTNMYSVSVACVYNR